MKYSVLVRCTHGTNCPELYYRGGKTWNRRHGSAGFACRIPTSLGIKQLKRYGYPSKADAEEAAQTVGKLLDLAGADQVIRAKIGDQIMKATWAGPLPDVEDVARRLGLHQDPGDPGVTFGEAWAAWLSGNRRLRPSARRRLEGIAEHWLLPVLADVPLERLNGAHCTAVSTASTPSTPKLPPSWPQATRRSRSKATFDSSRRSSGLRPSTVSSRHCARS